jgi:tetratricopeptide (TPR) repeat protein
MSKENVLFSVIGVLLGFIIGFVFANSVNQRSALPARAPLATDFTSGQSDSALPPDHPALQSNGVAAQGGMIPEVQATLDRARNEPDNFEAQMKAAEMYYRIKRYDEAISFLKRANQLRPTDYEAIVNLGNANFDTGRYEEAEKWYTAALVKKPDDVNVRTDLGLTFLFRQPPDVDRAIKEFRSSLERNPNHEQTLQNLTVALTQKGATDEAWATLEKLQQVNANNPAIPNLRAKIDALRSSNRS